MTERRRPSRRGREQEPGEATSTDALSDANPYLESGPQAPTTATVTPEPPSRSDAAPAARRSPRKPRGGRAAEQAAEQAAERQIETQGEPRGEQQGEPRAERSAERSTEGPADRPVERSAERTMERQAEHRDEQPSDDRPERTSQFTGQFTGQFAGQEGSDRSEQGRQAGPSGQPGQSDAQGGDSGTTLDDGGDRGGQQGRGRFRRFRHRNRNSQGGNQQQPQQQHQQHQQRPHQNNGQQSGGRRSNRRNRQQTEAAPRGPVGPIVVEGETSGLFDPQRDAGYLRNSAHSYLADANDPFVPTQLVRQAGLRRGDLVTATVGRDQRGRLTLAELLTVNGGEPEAALRRPEFASLIASYPDRKLSLETGRPAKAGPELTRRAIDLIAPIGYGQRALIVAPARAGKTMLLQAVIEGISINQPEVQLFVLLVDERPEEVSDMISIGHGEVVASSFDMPAQRHADVAEMTLERARRLVELGKDVVIVLDSITRLARAYNTIERGTGRTMSGGLDSSAMAKPKAFFGSARSVSPENGGGSLTIIATALVETGSRMDDVIFEEFKGTGNCEIKLDRSLAEKRIYPAIDIGISGTRREDKLFRPDQLEHVYTLRRGLQQMPSSSAMEWLIKRIAGTQNNDALLSGL
jgi:transcription termination factor Rho